MATSAITNTIQDPSGTALADVTVIARLKPGPGFRPDFTEIAQIESTTTDSNGKWTLTLERTAGIIPANSWWEIEEQIPESSGGPRVWTISVGSSAATLYASLVTPSTSTGFTNYISQSAADARYAPIGGGATGLMVNVTDSPYSATGDGSTDDTSAITTALSAVGAAGGGIVFFPEGTYKITSTITLDDEDVRLVGAGIGATTLILAPVRTVTDGAITATDTTLTSATANFTAGDVGRSVVVPGAGASAFRDALHTTIASINSSTSVEVTTAATNTVSGKTVQIVDPTFFEVEASGVRFAHMTIQGETAASDDNVKAKTAIAWRGGSFQGIDNVWLRRFRALSLIIGNDEDDTGVITTTQNFESRNLWITAYGNSAAKGIYINHGSSETCNFFGTFISSGANSAAAGTGSMKNTIHIDAGHAAFYGLIDDCDERTSADDYGILVDGGSIGIWGWVSECPQPIKFGASAHSRGSVISQFDWRSLDVGASTYALEYTGPASGVEGLLVGPGRARRKAGASNTPNFRLNNGVAVSIGVEFTSADASAAGAWTVTSTGYLVDLGQSPAFHNGLSFANNKALASKLNAGTAVDIAKVTTSDVLVLGASAGIATTEVRALTSVKLAPSGTSKLHVNTTGVGFFSATPQAQSAAIADASGGATIDAEARTALNALLAYLRLRGDIAT